MAAQIEHPGMRALAYVLAASSAAAMLYVGLYQSRAIQHLWCPVFGKGCQAVADAPFARPFGIPDGYIAAVLYGIILLLLLGPVEKGWIWIPLLVLVSLATLANALGVRDMAPLRRFLFLLRGDNRDITRAALGGVAPTLIIFKGKRQP